MEPSEQTYTTQDIVEGVTVISFVDLGPGRFDNLETEDRYIAEFRGRMVALGSRGPAEFAVVDFVNVRMTTQDEGRAMVGSVLGAHRRLKMQGGGLFVCNHPAQFNPDMQNFFHSDRVIDSCRSKREALDAARTRQKMN